MALLEELATSKSTELETQKKLMFFVIGSVILIIVLTFATVIVIKSRKQTQEELHRYKITDALTEVYNRRQILEIFESKLEGDNAVILLDMDHLKKINDQFGYNVGDEVLKVVAKTLKLSVRGGDVIGRYDGGEFLIILDYATQEECRLVAERIRMSIESLEWSYEALETTCSVGVTRVYSQNPDEVLQYVDTLLGQAKENGKNQVVYG